MKECAGHLCTVLCCIWSLGPSSPTREFKIWNQQRPDFFWESRVGWLSRPPSSCRRRATVHNNPDPYFSRQQTWLDRNVMETTAEALRLALSSAPTGAGFLWLTSCSPYQISFLSLSTFNCTLTVPPSFWFCISRIIQYVASWVWLLLINIMYMCVIYIIVVYSSRSFILIMYSIISCGYFTIYVSWMQNKNMPYLGSSWISFQRSQFLKRQSHNH